MRNDTNTLLNDILTSSAADGAHLARILNQLAEREVAEGGPYALTPRGNDTDLGLNVAVAVFLAAHDVHLPKLNAFIDAQIPHAHSSVLDKKTLSALLDTYEKSRAADPSTTAGPAYTPQEANILDLVRQAAIERFSTLPTEFSKNAQLVIERTMRGNPDKQMSLMALYVREALGEKGIRFSNERLAKLGLANVFFWTAFIIYDDFWDEDEAAEPKFLPVANLFARHYVQFFETVLPVETSFSAFFHNLMDKLDAANEWEMRSCRLKREENLIYVPDTLPDYGDFLIKFYPAAGHVLGPVAMFIELGYALDSKEVNALIEYFRHYLVAMQLNDDAHDWKEDLARGHISTAVYLLLKAWKEEYPERKEIDLIKDMQELERLFWFEILVPICNLVLEYAKQSRTALRSLTFLENAAPLEEFIVRNERIAKEALDEKERSAAFLAALNQ